MWTRCIELCYARVQSASVEARDKTDRGNARTGLVELRTDVPRRVSLDTVVRTTTSHREDPLWLVLYCNTAVTSLHARPALHHQHYSWVAQNKPDYSTFQPSLRKYAQSRMWASAQRDGRPAEHRLRPLFNAAKFS